MGPAPQHRDPYPRNAGSSRSKSLITVHLPPLASTRTFQSSRRCMVSRGSMLSERRLVTLSATTSKPSRSRGMSRMSPSFRSSAACSAPPVMSVQEAVLIPSDPWTPTREALSFEVPGDFDDG